MTTHNIQHLKPVTIKLDDKGQFGKKLSQLNIKGAMLAAVGVHVDAKQAQVTQLSPDMIDEAVKNGVSKRYVPFDKRYRYFGQVAKHQQVGIAALSAEENVEDSPAFTEVSHEIAKRFDDGTRMARRQGPSKLFGADIGKSPVRQVRTLDYSGKTQLQAVFAGDKLVTTTGQSSMRYIETKAVKGMLKGEQVEDTKAQWNEVPTPGYARTNATIGRISRRSNLIGLKNGQIATVELKDKGDKIDARFSDTIPGGKQIDGTTIGLLPGRTDIAVSVSTDERKGAIITLNRVDTLPSNVQLMLQGNNG